MDWDQRDKARRDDIRRLGRQLGESIARQESEDRAILEDALPAVLSPKQSA